LRIEILLLRSFLFSTTKRLIPINSAAPTTATVTAIFFERSKRERREERGRNIKRKMNRDRGNREEE
jgi:hypothetical protein